jgi:hypothetical protein
MVDAGLRVSCIDSLNFKEIDSFRAFRRMIFEDSFSLAVSVRARALGSVPTQEVVHGITDSRCLSSRDRLRWIAQRAAGTQ